MASHPHPDFAEFFAECPDVPRLAEFEAQASTPGAAYTLVQMVDTCVCIHRPARRSGWRRQQLVEPAGARASLAVGVCLPHWLTLSSGDRRLAGERLSPVSPLGACSWLWRALFWSVRTQTRLLTPRVPSQRNASAAGAPLRALCGQLQRWEPWSCVHGVRRCHPVSHAVSPLDADEACHLVCVPGTCCSTGTRSCSCTGLSRRSRGRSVRRC